MKLFYKKDYIKSQQMIAQLLQEKERLINQNTLIQKAYKSEQSLNEELEIENESNAITIDNMQKDYLKLDSKKNLLTEMNRKLAASNGGLTKQVNKLTKENESLSQTIKELEKKLEESLSDKYLVKKIKAQKTPNTQKTRVVKTVKPNVSRYQQTEFN